MRFGRRRTAAAAEPVVAPGPVPALSEDWLAPSLEGVSTAARESLWRDRRPAVDLARRPLVPGTVAALGASRLGGLPDLPEGTPWPTWTDPTAGVRPMAFFAQVDLAGLSEHLDVPLPADGLLLFFCDFDFTGGGPGVMGLEEGDVDAVRVVHAPAGSALVRTSVPGPVELLPSALLAPLLTVTLPDLEDRVEADEDYDRLDAQDQERREQLGQAAPDGYDVGGTHRLGGNPTSVQQPVERDAAYAAGAGRQPGPGPDDPADPASWTLLLQVDEDEGLGLWFGDAGCVYWLARRADLAAGDLSRVRFVFQCM